MTAEREPDGDLLEAATLARHSAYAPYSHFTVGAAVRSGSGRVFIGANVENASYGLTVCAERVAIFGAIAAGEREIRSVAVVTGAASPTPPCGACRQVIAEFGPAATVVAANLTGDRAEWSVRELLPHAFGPTSLE
jgi:cytidine deaminase